MRYLTDTTLPMHRELVQRDHEQHLVRFDSSDHFRAIVPNGIVAKY